MNIGVDVSRIESVEVEIATATALTQVLVRVRDENGHRLLDSGAIEYLQPEITKIGGLTPAKRISALAELYNVALCPHNFRVGPSLYASIHWGMSCPVSRWIEVPWIGEGLAFASGVPMPLIEDGRVKVPEAPGFGIP